MTFRSPEFAIGLLIFGMIYGVLSWRFGPTHDAATPAEKTASHAPLPSENNHDAAR